MIYSKKFAVLAALRPLIGFPSIAEIYHTIKQPDIHIPSEDFEKTFRAFAELIAITYPDVLNTNRSHKLVKLAAECNEILQQKVYQAKP